MLIVFMLSVNISNAVTLDVIMLYVVMLSVNILSVKMLNVVMLSVVGPPATMNFIQLIEYVNEYIPDE